MVYTKDWKLVVYEAHPYPSTDVFVELTVLPKVYQTRYQHTEIVRFHTKSPGFWLIFETQSGNTRFTFPNGTS